MEVNYIDIIENDLFHKIINDVIYISKQGVVYKIDFSNLQDGMMINSKSDYLLNATRKDGVLNVTLITSTKNEDFNIDNFLEVEIEWKSQDEIDFEQFEQSLIPPTHEIEKASRELETIELLIELEVI